MVSPVIVGQRKLSDLPAEDCGRCGLTRCFAGSGQGRRPSTPRGRQNCLAHRSSLPVKGYPSLDHRPEPPAGMREPRRHVKRFASRRCLLYQHKRHRDLAPRRRWALGYACHQGGDTQMAAVPPVALTLRQHGARAHGWPATAITSTSRFFPIGSTAFGTTVTASRRVQCSANSSTRRGTHRGPSRSTSHGRSCSSGTTPCMTRPPRNSGSPPTTDLSSLRV